MNVRIAKSEVKGLAFEGQSSSHCILSAVDF